MKQDLDFKLVLQASEGKWHVERLHTTRIAFEDFASGDA